jgi:UDP-2-acetamido-2-deoxy-ribo-hexuluronate aminotransferase
MNDIQMVDLSGQLAAIREEIVAAIAEVLTSTHFIKGQPVSLFETELAEYLGGAHAIGVGNGTDALQLAMMALDLQPGDEVITSAFTFIATAEAAALLGIVPVFADIDPGTFNIDPAGIEALISPRTRAIVPVHLFGQPADMDPILSIARKHGLRVIEDNAQSIGALYRGEPVGYLGDLGTLSFFPSKNLGAFGDGGAVLTNDAPLFERVQMIANHGSRRKYYNEVIGINSRLDTLQAAILRVKLRHLDRFARARQDAAARYDALFADCPGIITPVVAPDRTHVYHQYTLRIQPDGYRTRDTLAQHLKGAGIPFAIYYPTALHDLPVFREAGRARWGDLTHTVQAANDVISLPMHTELTADQQTHIAQQVRAFLIDTPDLHSHSIPLSA